VHKRIFMLCVCLLLASVLTAPALAAPVAAAQPVTPDEQAAKQQFDAMLELFDAYQGGYLQVVAVACFQLYYSTGIIATDFSAGNIDAETAAFALQKNSLLHSVCVTTIQDIFDKTPADDSVARQELKRLWDILITEDALLRALTDATGQPGAEAQAAVDTARQAVSAALEAYTKGMPDAPQDTPQ
jgi:hypothetical protein